MTTHSVFIVDDDRLTRESLCEIVAELGFDVADADCGLTALDRLRARPSEIVVSDVDMPDISGFELLARLHADRITIPMVLMSARADSALSKAAADAGAEQLFGKPVPVAPFTELLLRLARG